MLPTTVLTLIDGVRIVVPNSLELITPYVLQEQHDWFEDEIRFLRRVLRPGQNVIDIGANCGVYTLSMAKVVGPTGRVWAFEPASITARMLADSIAANGFAQVTLQRCALSSMSGTARLSLHEYSELNAVVHDEPPEGEGASESVSLVTLDDCRKVYGWQNIDFVKIDAEGEETNILKGGSHFFADLSPLVQFEVKTRKGVHMDLVQAFAALGYDSYRLVPGLQILIPFDVQSRDEFLLNLFGCKPDRAHRLAADGYLVESTTDSPHGMSSLAANDVATIQSRDVYGWRQTLAKLPYGAQLASLWEQTVAAGQSDDVVQALSLFAISGDSTLSAAVRCAALGASYHRFRTLCERQTSYLRLASLARVARAYGARFVAATALRKILESANHPPGALLSEPFLAPGENYDSISPGAAMGSWILSATLEEFERAHSYSSFYSGISSQQRLEAIRDLGFGSPEMHRRLKLLQLRFGLPTK